MKARKSNTKIQVLKTSKTKLRIVDNYENIKASYRYLDRADRAGKLNSIEKQILDLCLQLTAKTGWYVIDYDYLQDKIDRCRETVKRILETNSNLIKWRFERSLKVNGRKSYNVIVLERTEQVEKLLSESLQKLKEHRTKMHGVQHKNVWNSI